MRTTATTLMIAAAVLSAAVSAAKADNIQVDLNYWGAQQGTASAMLNFSLNSSAQTLGGGLMSLTKTGGTNTQTFVKTPTGAGFGTVGIAAFCIDLLQTLNFTANSYDVVAVATAPTGGANTAMGAAKASALGKLWRAYVNPSQTNNLPNTAPSLASGDYLAAQLAMWEIVYETSGTFDLDTGNFTRNGNNTGVYADAKVMIDWIQSAASAGAPEANLLAFSAPRPKTNPNELQDLVVEVPEAANIFSLAAIVLAAGVFNLKRFRQRQVARA